MSIRQHHTNSHKSELFIGALILVCATASACPQDSVLQGIDGSLRGQQFVSKNQLVSPRKARKATERACEDILHGHLELAQKELMRALDEAPHYGVALAVQGAVHLQTGNIDGAAKTFQQAMKDDPTLGAAYLGIGIVLVTQGKFNEALIPLNHASTLLPSSWYVHFELGLAHVGLGDTRSALDQAGFAERFAGSDRERRSGVSYLRATAYAVMNDSERAQKYFADAITLDPNGFYATLAKRRSPEPAKDGRY